MVDFMACEEGMIIDEILSYEDVSQFYHKAAMSYKLAKSWEQAGCTYIKLADCHLKIDSKHEIAAAAFVDAAHCFKKISSTKAISCLQQAIDLFTHTGRYDFAARCCKEAGELHEQLHNYRDAIIFLERATEFFTGEGASSSANQCKQKIAQFSARLTLYAEAIEIFEEMAREAAHDSSLKYAVRAHLLNAGICHLCHGDLVAITNALEQYQEFDDTFSTTQECKLLLDLVEASEEGDVEKFTEILQEYDSLSPLVSFFPCKLS
ncbi:hypothetical protein RND81_01G026800 [Saponaria officinalis]|uniref:Alpha-soluble NSF attachment protein n=1 Tax=Saponaria officinalis TaxID=3572 RepID=A0AAW1NDL6_SAPOF